MKCRAESFQVCSVYWRTSLGIIRSSGGRDMPRGLRFSVGGRLVRRLATLYCMGEPSIGVRLRSLHVRMLLRNETWRSAVDIGCGTGGVIGWCGGLPTTIFLLAVYHREAHLTGADRDQTAIFRNAELVRKAGIYNLNFRRLDLLDQINSDMEKQEVVIMADVVANRPNDERLIAGAFRLVRPGGRLILHVPSRHPPRSISRSNDEPDRLGVGYAEPELAGALLRMGADNVVMRRTFGRFGRLAVDTYRRFLIRGRLFAVLIFPVALLIALPDVLFTNSEGDGILVVASMPAEKWE